MSGCAQLHFARGREHIPGDAPGLAVMLCCPFVSPSKELLVVHEEQQWQGRDKAMGATICTGGRAKGGTLPLLSGAGPLLLHPHVPETYQTVRLVAEGEVCFRHSSSFITVWISRE